MNQRVTNLDGLRGLAIMLVLCVHFGAVIPATTSGEKFVQSIVKTGWCGVDLFFVLSGFLITGILLDTKSHPHYFRNFFARRILRIFPLYYGVLLLVFVFGAVWGFVSIDPPLWSIQWTLWGYISNLPSAISGPNPFRGDNLNFAHFWSLAIEEQFYLLWPFIVFSLSSKRLAQLCGVLVCTGIPIRYLAAEIVGPYAPYYLTPCRVETLAWGALAALAVRHCSVEQVKHAAKWLMIGGASGVILIFNQRMGLRFNDPIATIYGQTALAAFFCGLLLIAYYGHTWLDWMLRRPVLLEFGKLSYGIYVFHGLLQTFLWKYAINFTEIMPYFIALPAYIICCSGIAYGIARLSWPLECYFISFKQQFSYSTSPIESIPTENAASQIAQ